MNSSRKLGLAIAAILGGQAAGIGGAQAAGDANASSDTIQEITVTAQRRTESAQNVPISIQALTGETLSQLNIQTFDEFIKYVPNVNSASYGPGRRRLHARPVSTGSLGMRVPARRRPSRSRRLPRRSVGPAAEPQPRRVCRRHGAHRGAGGSAGHAVRRRRRGRRDPLHHQQAEARRHRGQRHGRLRHDGPRRPELERRGGAEPAGDRRYAGVRARDLRRQARRLHQQRARRPSSASEYRPRLSATPAAAFRPISAPPSPTALTSAMPSIR